MCALHARVPRPALAERVAARRGGAVDQNGRGGLGHVDAARDGDAAARVRVEAEAVERERRRVARPERLDWTAAAVGSRVPETTTSLSATVGDMYA